MVVDWYTKLVLTVIAAALVALAGRGLVGPAPAVAQLEACGTAARPCHVTVVGGPAGLEGWQGIPLLILESHGLAPR